MPVPFKVKAVYEYKSDEPDDLSFSNGQIITVIEEDDADWYTGEYTDASGQKLEGIFPRNFVEKYEPAVPSRPVRARPQPAPEPKPQEPVAAASLSPPPQQAAREEVEQPQPTRQTQPVAEPTPIPKPDLEVVDSPAPVASKSPPPAVASKLSSNTFRDRIAAFNKPAEVPITPFKPGSSGAVKKPFVAAPPSRNSYVPPPNYQPPPKTSRPVDESSATQNDGEQPEIVRSGTTAAEDIPKPTSLKDRIALLQQQQLEQAQRSVEKKKPKKPPTQRVDSTENIAEPAAVTEAPLSRQATGDTLGRKSIASSHLDESEAINNAPAAHETTVLPTTIPPPLRELVSDTNDADDSGADDTEDAPGTSTEEDNQTQVKARVTSQSEEVQTEDAAEEDEEADDEDPEIRRRRELRERMAKMSGGMGMMGMFGGGMPAPSRKPKAPSQAENRYEEARPEPESQRAPPVPVMPLPGMAVRPKQPELEEDESETDEEAIDTPVEHEEANEEAPAGVDETSRAAVQRTMSSRSKDSLPPPPPRDSRAPPVPISSTIEEAYTPSSPTSRAAPSLPSRRTTNTDEPSDTIAEDFSSPNTQASVGRQPTIKLGSPPPIPGRATTDGPSTSISDKRASRAPPPPVPSAAPTSPPVRAPPPPPPGQPPVRTATRESLGHTEAQKDDDDDSEAEVTEYDGDYDTDIASGVKHKAALKAHNRGSSLDEDETFTDDATQQSPAPPARAVPPLPPTGPRDLPPPPPPPQSTPRSRQSTDIQRGMPPPVPTSRPDDEDYDPYRYSAPPVRPPQSPPLRSPVREVEEEDMYGAPSPPIRAAPPPPPVAALPPMPPPRDELPLPPPPRSERAAPPLPPMNAPSVAAPSAPVAAAPAPSRMSTEIPRQSTTRHSADVARPSADYGFMATDLDLAMASNWWMHENTAPPSVQARNDVLHEVESSSSTKRGGKTTVTRDVYVLYQDLSQTTINVTFDASDPSQPSITQSHQRPPVPPRQDQLESASSTFGSQIVKAANSSSGSVIGDGSPFGLINEVLSPLRTTAIMPIGGRVFGALVYSNLGNASTQQFDEIRPGDIVTFRNAKFAGHKGGLHAKYSMDVGKPDHVGVVIDWDGTKKKIRAWEQGREEKGKKSKVREESFRVGDLKSGEVRVWRVMPRGWIGWEK